MYIHSIQSFCRQVIFIEIHSFCVYVLPLLFSVSVTLITCSAHVVCSPLLEEKLSVESGHMSEISQNQQETSDKLSRAKHTLSQVEDKSTKAHKRASKERENIENTLDECRLKLVMTE